MKHQRLLGFSQHVPNDNEAKSQRLLGFSQHDLHVPNEILANILSRLRVKPLLRFKCVSKNWNTLITSPNFIKLHRTRNQHTHILFRVVHTETEDKNRDKYTLLYTLDLDNALDNHRKNYGYGSQLQQAGLEFETLPEPEDSRTIPIGSCNGLVCLRNKLGWAFALYNPATRTRLKLPVLDYRGDEMQDCYYGFGYDSVRDDYKIVKIIRKNPYKPRKIMVYSWKNRGWREYEDQFVLTPFRLDPNPGVLSNNMLHWTTSNRTIICFDLCTDTFHYLSLFPDCPTMKTSHSFNLVDLGGFLHLLGTQHQSGVTTDVNTVNVWIMKEYGVKESWFKLGSLMIEHSSPLCDLRLWPISYSRKEENEILLLEDVIYPPKFYLGKVANGDGQCVGSFGCVDIHVAPNVVPYDESLVILNVDEPTL